MILARRLACLLLLALALSGCPSLTERAGLPPSLDRAEALEQAGEAHEAAKAYEDLAAHNSGSDRRYSPHAARNPTGTVPRMRRACRRCWRHAVGRAGHRARLPE